MPITTTIRPSALSERNSGQALPMRSDRSSFALASEDRTGRSYNEAAFRYFFVLERKRSERAGRSLRLLLVNHEQQAGSDGRFEPKVASRLFDALRSNLRDTDLIGWYRKGQVVGALLTHQVEVSGTDIERVIYRRVERTIREGCQREGAPRIQIRVHQMPTTNDTLEPWL